MTNQISEKAARKLFDSQKFTQKKTKVVETGDKEFTMFLHGNAIARIKNDRVEICNGTYVSQTTRYRLQAVIEQTDCKASLYATRRNEEMYIEHLYKFLPKNERLYLITEKWVSLGKIQSHFQSRIKKATEIERIHDKLSESLHYLQSAYEMIVESVYESEMEKLYPIETLYLMEDIKTQLETIINSTS